MVGRRSPSTTCILLLYKKHCSVIPLICIHPSIPLCFALDQPFFFISLSTVETVKTRLQVSGGTLGGTISGIASKEGIAAFWKGIVFAYGRELSYTSIKLGAYAPVRDALGAGANAPFYLKFLAGAITGGV